jgi:hypothetical protein
MRSSVPVVVKPNRAWVRVNSLFTNQTMQENWLIIYCCILINKSHFVMQQTGRSVETTRKKFAVEFVIVDTWIRNVLSAGKSTICLLFSELC